MIIYVSKHNDSSMVKDVLPVILGSQLKNAMISGSNNISRYKKQVNDLNIFPVPDGDTGTNMSMTIGAAADELKKLPDSAPASEVAKVAASSMGIFQGIGRKDRGGFRGYCKRPGNRRGRGL